MYYVYMVQCSDGTLYTGIATDVTRRIAQHNVGDAGAKYTRARRPVQLVYSAEFPDRSSASRAESMMKKLSRPAKLALIAEYSR